MGSIDSARRAGIHVAIRPSIAIESTTPAKTSGSRGVASNTMNARTRLAARGPSKNGQVTAKSGLARKLSCSCQDCTVWAPTAKPLMLNALDPKLSCSCQEDAAADVASDPAAADVHGCSPPVAHSAAATVSDSQDVPLATASDFPRRPGDTRRQSQVSYGDNRCGADVGTSADCTRFVEDDKRRAETNYDSKDNGGTGSSRLLRGFMG